MTNYSWQTLPNPFLFTDTSDKAPGHVSGRKTDIQRIITGEQRALVLAGAPCIGKTSLLRYLQHPPTKEWSWRQEGLLAQLRSQFQLDQLFFVFIDLTPLKQQTHNLLAPFMKECALAIIKTEQKDQAHQLQIEDGLSSLRDFLNQHPTLRYFVMIDSLERLDQPDVSFPQLKSSGAKTPQERGIALLNSCSAISTLVDLIQEFSNFGVIFSLESLPRPKAVDQFTHISADLARFSTITLQCFAWEDAQAFIAQKPEDFSTEWAEAFAALRGEEIFSADEQHWILEQAGTHPYLLQQLCYYTFFFKQNLAHIQGWHELQDDLKDSLLEHFNERISTLLDRLWKRLQEALEMGQPNTRSSFYAFVRTLENRQTEDKIDRKTTWNKLELELRYILSNEGLVRNDPIQPMHYPGAILRNYLLQQVSAATIHGFWVTLTLPNRDRERLSLSELEYRLLKTLIQHPKRCTEDELMKGAWGRNVERQTFTQRIHQLRKKLKDQCGVDVITNHYGGYYSLVHPSWIELE